MHQFADLGWQPALMIVIAFFVVAVGFYELGRWQSRRNRHVR